MESVATVLPEKLAIFNDLIVLIPGGAGAPGTNTTRHSGKLEFNQGVLLRVYRLIIYKYGYNVVFSVLPLLFIF